MTYRTRKQQLEHDMIRIHKRRERTETEFHNTSTNRPLQLTYLYQKLQDIRDEENRIQRELDGYLTGRGDEGAARTPWPAAKTFPDMRYEN